MLQSLVPYQSKIKYLSNTYIERCLFFQRGGPPRAIYIPGKTKRVLHRTRIKLDANVPYIRHLSSKTRRDLAKKRLTLEQPLTPVLR